MASTVAFLPKQVAQALSQNEASVGGYVYQIIRKQSKQIFERRSPTLKDTDPENLHQMRVATRRLRSALELFSDAIALNSHPDKNAAKSVQKLTKALGKVRDLDVMQQWFEQTLAPNSNEDIPRAKIALEKKEIKVVKKLLKTLKKRRKKQFSRLKKTLKSSSYKKLVRQFEQWLKQPVFLPVAEKSIEDRAIKRMISPLVDLIEHPGWLLMSHQQEGQIVPVENVTLSDINQQLKERGQQLHDLRKLTKKVRYQAEFLRGLYGTTYAAKVREFQDFQQILGQLQDQIVVSELLAGELGDRWSSKLPSIYEAFQASRVDRWQQWQRYQRKYLRLRSGLLDSKSAA